MKLAVSSKEMKEWIHHHQGLFAVCITVKGTGMLVTQVVSLIASVNMSKYYIRLSP